MTTLSEATVHLTPERSQQPSGNLPPPTNKRWLRLMVWLLLCLLLSLLGFTAWIAGTESGLRFGLYQLPTWFQVKITSQNLQGTLLKGFSGNDWKIETEGADVKISYFRFNWQPSELVHPSLHITELVAGDIAIVTKPTPPKEEEQQPPTLPDSIDLPVTVFIDRLETGRISTGAHFDKQITYIDKIKAAYHYDSLEHRLDLTELTTPWSTSAGAAIIGLQRPYQLNTAIYTQGSLEDDTIHGTTRLWGNLQDIQTQILLDGEHVHLNAKSLLHPFAEQLNDKVSEVMLKGSHINPAAFISTLPQAILDFDATLVPSFSDGIALDGSLDLANRAAGFADANSIPVRSILGEFTIDQQGQIHVKGADIQLLQQGNIQLSGDINTADNRLNLALGLKQIGTLDAVQQTFAGHLNGSVYITGETTSPQVKWDLDSGLAKTTGLLSVLTDPQQQQRTLSLSDVKILPDNGGELIAGGKIELFKNQLFNLNIRSKSFNPARIDSQLPTGNINGSIALNGQLTQPHLNGKMQFMPSTFNGVSLSGKADIAYQDRHLSRALTDIRLGSNLIQTNGSFGKKGDRLNLNLNAPDLSRFGFGLNGLLTAKGYLSGDLSNGIQSLETNLSGQARRLHLANLLQIRSLDFKFQGSPDTSKPLSAELKGDQIILAGESPTTIDAVNLFINGTGLNHRIRGGSSMGIADKHYKLEIDANGGLNTEHTQWKGTVNVLDISGAFNLKLQNRMNLEAGAERVSMSPARWAAMGGQLNLQRFVWDKKEGITTKGNMQNLHMEQLHNFYLPPVQHNLVLAGDWDLSYSRNAHGYLNIQRQSGDVIIPNERLALGLGVLSLRTRFENGRIRAALTGDTRFGKIDSDISINQQFGNRLTQAPLNGKVNLNIPNLNALRMFLPANLQSLSGQFSAAADIGGTIGSPSIRSTLTGRTNYGHADGTLNIGSSSNFMQAPLGGQMRLNVANLETFRNFLPVGQTIKGNVVANFALSGRLNEPQLTGTLNGDQLYYRNQAQGLILDNGVLRSHLQGRRWIIDSLKFHRGGTVELKGSVALDGMNPDVNATIVFDRYRTLSRPNRRLVLSGTTHVRYTVPHGVSLDGRLTTDFGRFGLQASSMPTLDDDVVVLGEAPKAQTTATPIYMNLDLDLNDNIRFIGAGLNVTLGGALKLTARPGESVRGVGSVNVLKGRYKAYGQDLDITKGTISFVGPLTDPNLNIRAERRLSAVGAGVEVLGNLSSPRVTLVANEPMSEKDKLSWLILNRASSGSSGDEATLSAAASALLAGQINDRIGLVDDLGFTSKRSRNAQTGELNPAEQVLTVGKQLTSELYFGYEYGLTSAEQSVKLVQQLTRAIQAVGRVGSESWGSELKYTIRFDTLPWQRKLRQQDQAAKEVQQRQWEQQQRESQAAP